MNAVAAVLCALLVFFVAGFAFGVCWHRITDALRDRAHRRNSKRHYWGNQ